MRARVVSLVNRFLVLFGEGFADPAWDVRLRLKHVLIQKVLRINAAVPWPVHWTTQVSAPHKIQRGSRYPGLSPGCEFDGRNGIVIGPNTWIGPRVSLVSMNHDPADYSRYLESEPIVIGANCWLGTNVVVLPGVRLGNHVICAAGSVVTASVAENDVLLAGTPARIVKRLPVYATARAAPPVTGGAPRVAAGECGALEEE